MAGLRVPLINASPAALRPPAHDSGPVWFATPSPYGSFIHYFHAGLSRRVWLSRIIFAVLPSANRWLFRGTAICIGRNVT